MSIEPLPHSPLGSGATFYFGPPGAPAGFSTPDASFAAQDVYVGCKHDENAAWSLLPAFAGRPGSLEPLPRGRYGRFLAWAGDKWMIGPLVFKLCTPFPLREKIDDEEFCYAPVVCGYLEYDNSHSAATAELIFGVGSDGNLVEAEEVCGWQFGSNCAFATSSAEPVSTVSGHHAFHLEIGPLSALRFTVPPHAKRIFPLVLAWHSHELYASRWFANVRSVLAYGLKNHERYIALSDECDAEFMRSSRSLDEKTTIARETRVWLASTRRGIDQAAIDLTSLQDLVSRLTARR